MSNIDDEEFRRYLALLDRALSQVPSKVAASGRFQMPKAKIIVVGNRTIIQNFKEIVTTLNRQPEQFFNFLLHELGTAGTIEDTRATLHGKFPKDKIDSLIEVYTKLYVICPVCKGIDTRLRKEGKVLMIHCEACGAISPVRGV
ncbi:MAG: translation initiation factor IF-2 subunit beta [Candidatus Nezhaarchaeota archaeon]|nr:translation initiation factor IF-2 subunit beta [Candidatus Nezhaarchaeota archaeon]MCX8141701.1 translation initiation factor IF-2 subunit beta [Candidatus Nezhaarchaeota archaeon]MDW8049968.1 translation initiation factor IF-2 subunit beta [Nitrososphaerota archaeon]